MLLRFLQNSNFSNSIHEDLSDLIQYVTPPDVPLYSRLKRVRATQVLHEWTETTNTSTFTDSVYAESSAPADTSNSTVRRNNKIMSIGRIAKASELLNASNTVGAIDAFAREVEEKMMDVMRAIEYWTYNGDVTQTAPQQMNGLLNILTAGNGTNVVANGGGALTEVNLQSVLVACYTKGGNPDLIMCSPTVAQRIANFVQNRTQYLSTDIAGGVSQQTLKYLSPLGRVLEIVPVRGDFLASGTVLVLDSSKLAYAELVPGIVSKELSIGSLDIVANRLIKSYVTLELRVPSYHGKITSVAESL